MRKAAWTNVALGCWLVGSAFFLRHPNGTAVTEDAIAGLFVALAALWSARAYAPRMGQAASWVTLLTAAWIVSAPFVLAYERTVPAVANEAIVGLAIMGASLADLVAWSRRTVSRV